MPITHIHAKSIDPQARLAKILFQNVADTKIPNSIVAFDDEPLKSDLEICLESFEDKTLDLLRISGTYDNIGDSKNFLSRADMTKAFVFENSIEFVEFFKYAISLDGYPIEIHQVDKQDTITCIFRCLVKAQKVFLSYGDLLMTNVLRLEIHENQKVKNFRVAYRFGESVLKEWHTKVLDGALMLEICSLFESTLLQKVLVQGDLRISQELAEYFLENEMSWDPETVLRGTKDTMGQLLVDLTPKNKLFKKYLNIEISQDDFEEDVKALDIKLPESFNVVMPKKTTLTLLDGDLLLVSLTGILGLKLVKDFYNKILYVVKKLGYVLQLSSEQVACLDTLEAIKAKATQEEVQLIAEFSNSVVSGKKATPETRSKIVEIYRRSKA